MNSEQKIMNNKIKKLAIFFTAVIAVFLASSTVLALEAKYPTIMGKSIDENSTIGDFVCYLFNAGVIVAIFIAMIAIAAGGILYLIDYSRGKFTTEAKDWIKSALLGLLIIVCSAMIMYTINPALNKCEIAYLPHIDISLYLSGEGDNNAYVPPIDTYVEFPMGKLVENLLTETTLCGPTDAYGDIRKPPESQLGGGGLPATVPYKSQDRVACLLYSIESAQKIMNVSAVLGQKITKLMELCSCRCRNSQGIDLEPFGNKTTPYNPYNIDANITKCDPPCNYEGSCPGGSCEGNKEKCNQKEDTYDCCPIGIKNIIEHGPIFIPEEELYNPTLAGMSDYPGKIQGTQEPAGCRPAGFLPQIISLDVEEFLKKLEELENLTDGIKQEIRDDFMDLINNLTDDQLRERFRESSGFEPEQWQIEEFRKALKEESETMFNDLFNREASDEEWKDIIKQMREYTDQKKTSLSPLNNLNIFSTASLLSPYLAISPSKNLPMPTGSASSSKPASSTASKSKCKLECSSDTDCPNGGLDGGEVCRDGKCGKEYRGLDDFRCQFGTFGCSEQIRDKALTSVGGRGVTGAAALYMSTWKKMTLWHKLQFWREDSYRWTEIRGMDRDIHNLKLAKSELRKCYAVVPYADLIATYEITEQEKEENKRIIVKKTLEVFDEKQEKTRDLRAVVSGLPVEPSPYCKGFNYNESSCLKQCYDMCPDYTEEIMKKYYDCKEEIPENANTEERKKINEKVNKCIQDAYKNRKCDRGVEKAGDTFSECIGVCRQDCQDACTYQQPRCSIEYEFCRSRCAQNGKCALDNIGGCLITDGQKFVDCAEQFFGEKRVEFDSASAKQCIENAYSCKNGSNQNPGGEDCVLSSSLNSSGNILTNESINNHLKNVQECQAKANKKQCDISVKCLWDESANKCLVAYPPKDLFYSFTASYLYKNKNTQKCVKAYEPATSGDCVSSTGQACINVCPETTKCPTSSDCPECPCTIMEKVPYTALKESTIVGCPSEPPPFPNTNQGREGYEEKAADAFSYQTVGPQCIEMAYNDDPLTFYCLENWWDHPKKESFAVPVGKEKKCDKSNDIPVGQTVDASLAWAQSLVDSVAKEAPVIKGMKDMLDQMKKIGDAINNPKIKDYCTCSAKCENNWSACNNKCEYQERIIGYIFDVPIWECWCGYEMCKGQPCQQIMDYHSELWNILKEYKENAYINWYAEYVTEPRSDILKKLTYSRDKMSECGIDSTSYGQAERRALNCYRAEDELVPPINYETKKFMKKDFPGKCYGIDLGAINNTSMADDWYCCERYINEDEQSSNNSDLFDPKSPLNLNRAINF